MKPLKQEEKKLLAVCVVLTLLVIVATVAVPGLGLLSGLRKIASVRLELDERTQELEDAKNKEKYLPQLKERIAQAEDEIEEVERRLPNDKRAPQLFKELNDLASVAKQKYMSMEARPVVEKNAYIEIPLEINLKADYHNLGRYINMIERSKRFAKVDGIDIEYDFEDTPNQNVSLTLSTFMFVEKRVAPAAATTTSEESS